MREPTRHDLYKTKPCRNFIKGIEGSCPFRDRCDYIHDEMDEMNEKEGGQKPATEGQILVTLLKVLSRGDSASPVDYFASRNEEGMDMKRRSCGLSDTQAQLWGVIQELEDALLGSCSNEGGASFNNFVCDLWNKEEEDKWQVPFPHDAQVLGSCGVEKDFDEISSESGYSSLNSTPRRLSLSQDIGQRNFDIVGDVCGIEEEIEAYWCEYYNPSGILETYADTCIEDILAE